MDRGNGDEFRNLILKAKEGDEAAFGRLYTEWYAPVFRFVLVRVSEREVAEDLTQDVFLKLFSHLTEFKLTQAHPLGYLFTIARNTVIDYHKKRKSESLEALELPDLEDEAAENPQSKASVAFDVEVLTSLMRNLTREQQDVVTLRFIEELSVGEVAGVMGKTEDAVRQLSVRALRALKEHFFQYET